MMQWTYRHTYWWCLQAEEEGTVRGGVCCAYRRRKWLNFPIHGNLPAADATAAATAVAEHSQKSGFVSSGAPTWESVFCSDLVTSKATIVGGICCDAEQQKHDFDLFCELGKHLVVLIGCCTVWRPLVDFAGKGVEGEKRLSSQLSFSWDAISCAATSSVFSNSHRCGLLGPNACSPRCRRQNPAQNTKGKCKFAFFCFSRHRSTPTMVHATSRRTSQQHYLNK